MRISDWSSDVCSSDLVTFLAILALAAVNAVGLVFSGMESGLQVMLALAACVGLAEFLHDGKVRWWLVGGIVLGPLIRYENLTEIGRASCRERGCKNV